LLKNLYFVINFINIFNETKLPFKTVICGWE
jgi:hypothetical protein